MDEQLIALYHRHVAMAFDRQQRLADFIARKVPGEKPSYDVTTATLAYGKLKFEAPILGSHAEHNNFWLWAWSNKNLKLSITNRALGDTVRMLVHRLGVHALAAPGFSLEPLIGTELTEHATHVFGTVLGRELDYNAYYTVPFEGGRATILVRDTRLDFTERKPLRRILTIFPELVGMLPVFDHKLALTSYASDYGLTVSDVPGGAKLTDGKDELIALFNDRGRLTKLSGTVTPEVLKPAKKRAKKPVKKKVAAKKTVKKVKKKPAKKR